MSLGDKGCKGYCFKTDTDTGARKTCNKHNCRNKTRAKKILKKEQERLKETSYKLLDTIMKNLY